MAATGPKLVNPEERDPSLALFAASETAGLKIEYQAELIDRIRAEAVGALLSIPHGGLEIAGILFGKTTGRTVYLVARRPIQCEHAAGPAFHLSKRDGEQLEGLLLECRRAAELQGLEVVGWYVSHTRRPPGLAPSDSEVFDRFFPGAMQISGVVQPAASGQAHFGWFGRGGKGPLDRQRPLYEFTAQPSATAPQLAPEPAAQRGEVIALRRPPRDQPPAVVASPGAAPDVARAAGPRRAARFPAIAAGLALLIAAGGAFWYLRMRPQPAFPPLHVVDTGTQLRIDWDPGAPLVQNAQEGVLELRESGGAAPVRIGLSKDMLRAGSVLYNQPSSKVEIHLQLKSENGSVAESMIYFIGREQEPKKPPAEAVAQVVQRTPAPVEVRRPDTPKETPPSEAGSAERARSVAANPRAFQPPAIVKTAPDATAALAEAPKIALPPIAVPPSAIPTNLIPQIQASLPPAPLRAETAAPAPALTEAPKAAPPASGRLIWTGELKKGTVLQLSEKGASAGSLNGKLPARPIKVSVHSAELLDGAIAIYTADPNSTRSAEAPGRRNGWNVTLYKFDPKHVRDLSLVETPAEENHWRLGIRSVARPVSIIVIDWQDKH